MAPKVQPTPAEEGTPTRKKFTPIKPRRPPLSSPSSTRASSLPPPTPSSTTSTSQQITPTSTPNAKPTKTTKTTKGTTKATKATKTSKTSKSTKPSTKPTTTTTRQSNKRKTTTPTTTPTQDKPRSQESDGGKQKTAKRKTTATATAAGAKQKRQKTLQKDKSSNKTAVPKHPTDKQRSKWIAMSNRSQSFFGDVASRVVSEVEAALPPEEAPAGKEIMQLFMSRFLSDLQELCVPPTRSNVDYDTLTAAPEDFDPCEPQRDAVRELLHRLRTEERGLKDDLRRLESFQQRAKEAESRHKSLHKSKLATAIQDTEMETSATEYSFQPHLPCLRSNISQDTMWKQEHLSKLRELAEADRTVTETIAKISHVVDRVCPVDDETDLVEVA